MKTIFSLKTHRLKTIWIYFFTTVFTGLFAQEKNPNFVIAFGSCDNQNIENKMWTGILKNKPDVFIWGGDVIYNDTEDMKRKKKIYQKQKNDPVYLDFIKKTEVIGTWDDHDYGENDGGADYKMRAVSQQLFLDFLDVPKDDIRRKRPGVYFAKDYRVNDHSIRIIVLDTRYFRSPLTRDHKTRKRYKPNPYGEGTMLGEAQWKWLEQQLKESNADFNIIVSSIQFLSGEHGFETWANMPHEVDRLNRLITESQAKGVIILSGDRHIAEISAEHLNGLTYPVIDITSSGLTHSYSAYSGEPNRYRISNVVPEKNFGILKFRFRPKEVTFEIRGENNRLFESYTQKY